MSTLSSAAALAWARMQRWFFRLPFSRGVVPTAYCATPSTSRERLGRHHVTSATKSNGIYHSMPYWDERFHAIASDYPDIRVDQYHIDILCARFVMSPERFDVVVASNLFGDILSDLGPGVTGTIAVAPSANINPERRFPSMFEPVHGSAPDIAGQGIANPIGQIWAARDDARPSGRNRSG